MGMKKLSKLPLMKKRSISSIINIILLVLIIILLIFSSTNRCQTIIPNIITTEKEAIAFTKQNQEIIDFEKLWTEDNIKIKYMAHLQKDGQWFVNVHPKDSADADYIIIFYPNKTITQKQKGWIPQ